MIGTWTSKQDQENQESSDEKETECDSVVLKTFHLYAFGWLHLIKKYGFK